MMNRSNDDGKAFIQEWLTSLSLQEREALDASFRECLPKLRQIESTRRAALDTCEREVPPVGFERALSSIDEIEDFEGFAQTIGIDSQNLTAGEVVAIALEWLKQQELDTDQQKVVQPRILELQSKQSRQTALDNLRNDAMMDHVDIAVALDLPPESLRTQLERWRKVNQVGWQDMPDAGTNEPRFVYRIAAIRAVLMEAIVASYRTSGKSWKLVSSDELD